jgi:hypothetical protein
MSADSLRVVRNEQERMILSRSSSIYRHSGHGLQPTQPPTARSEVSSTRKFFYFSVLVTSTHMTPSMNSSVFAAKVPDAWPRTVRELRERKIVPNSEALPRFCWADGIVHERKLLKGFGYGRLWVTVRRRLSLCSIII